MAAIPQSSSERSPLLRSSSASSTLTASEPQDGASEEGTGQLSTGRGVCIAASVFVLIFILTCNVSLIATIQSPIAVDLEAFSSVSWFASAYLIAITSITPVAGRLSQIFTARVYLLASILIQAIGLLITALAQKLSVFLVGRVLTGIGSAAVTPIALILVTELTSKKRRGLCFGCVNTGYTTGVASGAIIAGALEPVIGWRGVFGLQIPVALTAATVAFFSIPAPKLNMKASMESMTIRQKLSRIDYFGLFTLICTIVLFLYGLSASEVQVTPLVLSACMLVLFLFVEARWAFEPIVPIPILRHKGNLLTGFATIGTMTARWSILFYTPIYAIAVRGWSQASGGLMLIPTNGGFALGGILAGWLHIRRAGSYYWSCLIVFFLFAATHFTVSQISNPTMNVGIYVVALFLNGFFTGALLNYTLAHVLHLTLPANHVIVIPLNSTFRSLSGSFGSAISGGIFLRELRRSLVDGFTKQGVKGNADLINKLVGTPLMVHQLTGIEREVAVDSYTIALRTLFMSGSALALAMLAIQAGTGWTAPDEKDNALLSNSDGLPTVATREPATN